MTALRFSRVRTGSRTANTATPSGPRSACTERRTSGTGSYEAALTPEAQLDYLDGLKKLTEAELRTNIGWYDAARSLSTCSFSSIIYRLPRATLSTEFRILDYVAHDTKGQPQLVGALPIVRHAGHDRSRRQPRHSDKKSPPLTSAGRCTKEEIRAALGQPIRRKVAVLRR